MRRNDYPTSVRLPRELRTWVLQEAKRTCRSISELIVYVLQIYRNKSGQEEGRDDQ